MLGKFVTRRTLIKGAGISAVAAVLSACAPKVVEKIVKETVVVEKAVKETVVVEKKVEVVKEAARKPAEVIMMYNTGELTDDQISLFNSKYAPYKLTRIDPDTTKLAAMLAAGDPIDVVRTFGTFIPRYVIQRLCKDLTDYFALSTVLKEDDILPVNSTYVVNKRRYGMIKDWSPDFNIWANKKLWREAGVDMPEPTKPMPWPEWRALSPKLTKKEGDRTLVMGTDFEVSMYHLMWLTSTFEPQATLFNDDLTKLVLRDNPKTLEAIKFIFDWKKEKGLPSAINPFPSESWSGQDWVQGQAAAVSLGYWFSGMAVSEKVAEEDIVMLSTPQWGPNYTNPCISGCGAFITTATRVPDAAWKVFEWFIGEEPAQDRAKSGWGVPALKSMLPLMPVDKPWRRQAYDMVNLEISRTKTAFARWSPYLVPDTVLVPWSKYEEPALKGEITLDTMLTNIEAEVNEAMQEAIEEAKLL